mmetsp:Transcript_3604/g.10220  ORF Transcript_3604/g.10220 Transcript_3604/m.10220 type:complete len:179 (+) Transcript_3604:228-764(+)
MDSSHVSLCALVMRSDGFDHFRCDRSMPLGINLQSMAKVLKCCNKDDIVTLKAEDDGDSISFMFESNQQDKISDFELKLMDIDSEHLGIPETEYKATVTMPASEFTRICNDLSILGETVAISVGKDGVKFSVTGEMVSTCSTPQLHLLLRTPHVSLLSPLRSSHISLPPTRMRRAPAT